MITFICGIGMVMVLSTILMKKLEPIVRSLICWTFSSLAAVLSMAVFFSQNRFSVDVPAILFALGGVGIMAVIIMLIELFAPAKRFARTEKTEYNVIRSEKALDLVMIIITSALIAAAVTCEQLDMLQLSGICLVPSAAISIRQLSFYLHLAKLESVNTDTDERKRHRVIVSLGENKGRKL